ncbi:MAG: prepilin peptidase [Actinobacteria bacterium]|nr:prepilin peptidase [Actinomycetota bacterium]
MLRLFLYGILGLAFGSFLTVVVHRVPRGESLIRPGSRCPSCGVEIRARDNVPLLSWLVLRGRCRACGAPISALYPLVELATAALFVGAALELDGEPAAAIVAPFLGVMVALGVIDARHRILPNRIVYPSVLLAALAVAVADLAGGEVDAVRAAIGFASYGGALLVVAFVSPAGMGMGDVKLAALIGLVLGSLGLSYVAVAAALGVLLGGVGAVLALLLGRAGRKQAIPFGPYLATGAVLAAFVGPEIASAYLRLL